MKKAQGSNPDTLASQSSSQKTLLHYFKCKPGTSTIIDKVTCPACSSQVPKSKINWHLDHYCKSNAKGKKNGKSATSKKKALNDKTKARPRKCAVLSDSEDDSEELFPLDLKQNESPDSNDSDFDLLYISSSMVETIISEESEDLDEQPTLQGLSHFMALNNTSPYFSSDSKKIQNRPMERQVRLVTCDLASHEQNTVSLLKSDWDSPEKVEKEPQIKLSQSSTINSNMTSPQTKSGKAVKAMLEQDWKFNSPEKTSPKKEMFTHTQDSSSSRRIQKTNSDSEDDFEENTFIPSTARTPPKKLPNKDEFEESEFTSSTAKTSNPMKMPNEDDFENSTFIPSTPKNLPKCLGNKLKTNNKGDIFKIDPSSDTTPDEFSTTAAKKSLQVIEKSLSPKKNSVDEETAMVVCINTHEVSPSSSGSLILSSSTKSPMLVTPVRSPSPCTSPLPPKASSTHVKKLSFATDPFESNPKENIDCIPEKLNKVNVSSKVQNSVKAIINNVPHASSSNDDIFDSLSQSISQQQKYPYRSPRKFHQGLKKTGLLENSSQSLTRITPRKKNRSMSPGSASTPEKSDSSQQSPSKNMEVGAQQGYDPARYRHYKGYYLENFLKILDTVMSEPQDLKLFNDEDMAVINTFQNVSLSAQKLYVRLFQRKIKWNKLSKIEYREICDREDTQLYVNELVYADLLHGEKDLTELDEILSLLSSDELQKLCKQMKLPSSGKKENLVNALLKFSAQQRTIKSALTKGSAGSSPMLKKAKEMLGPCCLVDRGTRRVFMRMLLLYGLPRYDDDEDGGQQAQLTTLLMVNMGKMKFPQYDTKRKHAIFRSRDDLLRFEEVSQVQVEVQESMEGHRWEAAMELCKAARDTYHQLLTDNQLIEHDKSLPRFLRRFTSLSLLVYILTCGVECYQRLKDYKRAVEQLQELLGQATHLQDYRGRWYDRLALNLQTHLKKPKLAVEAIDEALKDPEVRHGHRLSLSIRAQRLAASARHKALAPKIAEMPLMEPREAPKVIIEGRSLHADMPGYRRMFIRQDSARHAGVGDVTVCSVEELTIGHYKSKGYTEGLHREGTTIKSLFGLLFWDVLYAPVPDVFRSPYQAAPLDLDDAHFYTAREELIESRLGELRRWSDEECKDELHRVWTEHAGEVSLVAWDLFRSLEQLKGLVCSLGLTLVASMCERLARDHRFTRSGFPDLIVWNPITKVYRIVEVKGPNDRLSTKQILWLNYLLAHDAVAEVCHVEAIGAKKMWKASPRKVSPKKVSPKKSPRKSKTRPEEDSDVEFQEKMSKNGKGQTKDSVTSVKGKNIRKDSNVKKKRKRKTKESSSCVPEPMSGSEGSDDVSENTVQKKRKRKGQ